MIESTAAGVVQHTNSTTIEMRTSTSILSSGLCRDFLRVEALWAEVRSKAVGGLSPDPTSKPESGQRESLGARSQLVRLTLQVAIVMFTEAAGDEGGVEARRLEGFPGIDESE